MTALQGITPLQALRALRDCRVLRVGGGNRAFGVLVETGLATADSVRVGDRYVCDYMLTAAGEAKAAALPPTPGGTKR